MRGTNGLNGNLEDVAIESKSADIVSRNGETNINASAKGVGLQYNTFLLARRDGERYRMYSLTINETKDAICRALEGGIEAESIRDALCEVLLLSDNSMLKTPSSANGGKYKAIIERLGYSMGEQEVEKMRDYPFFLAAIDK